MIAAGGFFDPTNGGQIAVISYYPVGLEESGRIERLAARCGVKIGPTVIMPHSPKPPTNLHLNGIDGFYFMPGQRENKKQCLLRKIKVAIWNGQ
jgi:hypothetical protein